MFSFSTESGKVESLFEVPRERGPITEIGADEENIFVIADGQKFSLYSLPDCVAMILGSTPEPVLHGDSFHKDGIFIYVDGQADALWLVAPEGSGDIEIPDELCTFPNNVARWGSTVVLSCKKNVVSGWYNRIRDTLYDIWWPMTGKTAVHSIAAMGEVIVEQHKVVIDTRFIAVADENGLWFGTRSMSQMKLFSNAKPLDIAFTH